ncbi:Uncharacterized protein CTYZ_00000309 [Cryptosporidium tyzzeri]|uniref:Hyaluronan/mRNA-binding protein domain-containing protein n=1 Tax=Cryptosporidium hominis TaxID=237895 RepID=A0A0S4TL23_CRYHO|nr:hypothetical protein ChTU502y2012_421g0555 [Cryptosporidium hominis]PPA64727.1 hypothetical protein ChUKH1_01590 [Cryptosporidium hominis]PPS98096.1 Uncharacterized protein GY17_00000721 [Cryptosporidium hominis]TRY50116.1 Uncharacterized protein CTYZ_00000309 [Cryptosporidium tyzzeri]CUV07835.1 unnamed protein product [Cryptosporidium hominis]|eukprot:PPS98096.1 Uncharacterized protein GY17_00000721 [Cryptosporidium hominis]
MTHSKPKHDKDTRLDRHSMNPKSSAYGNKSGIKGGSGKYNWGEEGAICEQEPSIDSGDPMYNDEKKDTMLKN